MAEKKLSLLITGDASGGVKALSQIAGKSESTGKRSAAAFRAAGAGITQALGPALEPLMGTLDHVSGAFEGLKGKGKSVGTVLAGTGVAATGMGSALVMAASGDIAAHQQLQASIAATGHSYDEYGSKIEEQIKHNERFGDTAGNTQDSLRILTDATGNTTIALKYQGVAADLAASKHESLTAASEQLAKVINGKGNKFLAAYGITMDKVGTAAKGLEKAQKAVTQADDAASKAKQKLSDVQARLAGKTKLTVSEQISLRNAQQNVTRATDKQRSANQGLVAATVNMKHANEGSALAVDKLSKKLKGQAAAAADTWHGKLQALKAKLEDTAASIGQKYGPAITAAGAATGLAGAAIEGLKGPLGHMKTALGEAGGLSGLMSKVAGKASSLKAVGSTLLDIGKAGAQAALGVAKSVVQFGLQKVAMLASAVAEKVTAAAQWLLNAAMDANPIGLVVIAIAALVAGLVLAYKKVGWFRAFVDAAFKLIGKVVKWAVDFIKGHWKLLLAILTGPIGLAVLFITNHWKQITAGFKAVGRFISSTVGDIVRFIMSIPGRIMALNDKVWHILTDPVANAYNWIHGKIDSLVTFFMGLPGRMAAAVGGMWDGIWSGFKGIINNVIGAWNNLHLSINIPKVHVPGTNMNFGGGTFGLDTPDIPYLHTGGIYRAPRGQFEGLAMLRDGERVLTPEQQRRTPGGSGSSGGDTYVHLEVHGTVVTEHQLIEVIRRAGAKVQQGKPTPIFAGLA